MHKLDRGAAPRCLSQYTHRKHNWSDLPPADRESIWQSLEAMQGLRCAYCEGLAGPGGRHLEHFEQRRSKPQSTFLWDNILGSCNRNDSCGKHKDRQKYARKDLIKPDAEDPEAYFLVVGTTGEIAVRDGLGDRDRHRARETIRVLNLNGALSEIRKVRISPYVQDGLEARSWLASGQATIEEIADFFKEEISATADSPYATAIRHTLLPFR